MLDRLKSMWHAREVIRRAVMFQPWDYAFMLRLEKACFQAMAPFYEYHSHLVSGDATARDARLAVKLLDILLENDTAYDINEKRETYLTKHVNTRNWKRFLKKEPTCPSLVDGLRLQKALYLYCKLRYYKLFTWWD